jgi:hypothetical protein
VAEGVTWRRLGRAARATSAELGQFGRAQALAMKAFAEASEPQFNRLRPSYLDAQAIDGEWL